MSFTIEKDRHIFACWAASRAAGASPLCRFKVEKGKEILDEIFGKDGKRALDNSLKENQKEFDDYHDDIIKRVIEESKKNEIQRKEYPKDKNFIDGMSYGVAAKLINLYFKVIFICGNYKDNPRINYIHPPIDSLLLDSLYKEKKDKLWKETWSNMTSERYKKIIDGIKKEITENDGLWSIEKHWEGHQ
jgi:hypothetical protein|tara:strand:- start:32 stop:598 length:567 start_codon:yes stop_codon:yes gene_type:complete